MSTPHPRIVGTPLASRAIGRHTGPTAGPTLIAVGSLHGNEPAGVAALQRVVQTLQSSTPLVAGAFVALAGNLTALAAGQRFIDRDLNRNWNRPRIEGGSRGRSPMVEDTEQQELSNAIDAAIAEARGDVFVLDLHTMSAKGAPFTVFADTLKSRAFGRTLPSPVILGLEEHLEGTLVDHLAMRGIAAAAVEGGQHDDPIAIDCLEAATWIVLDRLGIARADAKFRAGRALLSRAAAGIPRALEIRARHGVQPGDGFRMHAGFATFDRVIAGELLAADATGEIHAPANGYLLMPLYQELGDDGFFIAEPVWQFWLTVSRILRVARTDRIVHWLPGVRKDPAQPGLYHVDQHVARWFALEVLHLLGFKRIHDGDELLVTRRRHDAR